MPGLLDWFRSLFVQPSVDDAPEPLAYALARGATFDASLGSRGKPAAQLTARQLATPGYTGVQLQGPRTETDSANAPAWLTGNLWNVYSKTGQTLPTTGTGAPRSFSEALARLTAGSSPTPAPSPAFQTSLPSVPFASQPTAQPAIQPATYTPQAPTVYTPPVAPPGNASGVSYFTSSPVSGGYGITLQNPAGIPFNAYVPQSTYGVIYNDPIYNSGFGGGTTEFTMN